MAEEEEYADDPIRLFDFNPQLYATCDDYYREEAERSIFNSKLLNECKPLNINIVDCEKHPWYYANLLKNNNNTVQNHDIMNTGNLNKQDNKEKQKRKPRPIILGSKMKCSNNTDLKIGNRKKGAIIGELNLTDIRNMPLLKNNQIEVNFKRNSGLVGFRLKFQLEMDEIKPRYMKNRSIAMKKLDKMNDIDAEPTKSKALHSPKSNKSKNRVTKKINQSDDDTFLKIDSQKINKKIRNILPSSKSCQHTTDKSKKTLNNKNASTHSSIISESLKGREKKIQPIKPKAPDNYIIKNSKDTTFIFKKVEAQNNQSKLLEKPNVILRDNECDKIKWKSNQNFVPHQTMSHEKQKPAIINFSENKKFKKIIHKKRIINKEIVVSNNNTLNGIDESGNITLKDSPVIPNITVTLLNNTPNNEVLAKIRNSNYTYPNKHTNVPNYSLDPPRLNQVRTNDIINECSLNDKNQTSNISATTDTILDNILQSVGYDKELNTSSKHFNNNISNGPQAYKAPSYNQNELDAMNQMDSINNPSKVNNDSNEVNAINEIQSINKPNELNTTNTSENLNISSYGRPIETVLTRQMKSLPTCQYDFNNPQKTATNLISNNTVNQVRCISAHSYPNTYQMQDHTGSYMINNNQNDHHLILRHRIGIPPSGPMVNNFQQYPNYHWVPSYHPYFSPPTLLRPPQPHINYENYIHHTNIPTSVTKNTKSTIGKNVNNVVKEINVIQKDLNINAQNLGNVNLPTQQNFNLQKLPYENVRKEPIRNIQNGENLEINFMIQRATNVANPETPNTNLNEDFHHCKSFYRKTMARKIVKEITKGSNNNYDLNETKNPSKQESNARKQYSPPILPIPTYEKSLELLAKDSEQCVNQNQPKYSHKSTSKEIIRKEKNRNCQKKTITLEEYKNRVKISPNSCVDLTLDETRNKIEED